MPLSQEFIESVANSNLKAMSEFAVQNLLSHQQRLQVLAEKSTATSLISMDNAVSSVAEGVGLQAEAGAAPNVSGIPSALTEAIARLLANAGKA